MYYQQSLQVNYKIFLLSLLISFERLYQGIILTTRSCAVFLDCQDIAYWSFHNTHDNVTLPHIKHKYTLRNLLMHIQYAMRMLYRPYIRWYHRI